jgi:hypothetical protein
LDNIPSTNNIEHYERMARAWEIVNRRQQDQDQEQESESELSVLASYLFNSMEAIETGGAELGDVGIGRGVAD